MSGFKKFLYVIYTLLFVATIGMFIYNDSLIATFDQPTMYTFWMFWSLLGFVLLMLESVFENIHLWSVKRGRGRLERENLELKARLYDQLGDRNRDAYPTKNRTSDQASWRRDNDVVDGRDEGDLVRIRERDGDEKLIQKDQPGRRDDITDVRDEGASIRVRERDGSERVIPKEGGKRSFWSF